MELFFQLVVDGLGKGAIYASLALALVVAHRSTGMINFAQGEFATLSTILAASLTFVGVNIWVALLCSVLVSFVAGAIVQSVIVKPFQTRSHLAQIVVTVGLFVCANAVALLVFGPTPRAVPSLFPGGGFEIVGIRITWSLLGVIALLSVVMIALALLFTRTRAGLAFRAVATAPAQARVAGIRVERAHMLGWGLAAAVGAVSGVCLTNLGVYLQSSMMTSVLVFSLAAITIGGFDSAFGAIVGGLLMGVAETVASSLVPGLTGDTGMLISLVAIVAVLLIKPSGLFGRQVVARV